jgi:peptidoglycan hydrolase-like protein with peptidoglycan-binding domain
MNKVIVGGLALAFLAIAVPQARASEMPNILAGEDMTIGSTGQGVVVLQGLLSEGGYLSIPIGISPGYFGAMTRAALAQYQTAHNVSPAVGYFGPLTKVAMHQELTLNGSLFTMGW